MPYAGLVYGDLLGLHTQTVMNRASFGLAGSPSTHSRVQINTRANWRITPGAALKESWRFWPGEGGTKYESKKQREPLRSFGSSCKGPNQSHRG